MDAHRVAPRPGRRRSTERGGQRVCRCWTALPQQQAGCRPAAGLLLQWLLAELAPVRLIPWVPIAFGAGIACYFAADREPHVWAVLSVAIGAVAVAFVARRRPFGFPLAVGTAGVFAGLAIATLQTAISDASIGHGACQILIGRWLVGVVLAVGGQSCARRCVGAALSLPQARSPGPWRSPSLTFWWPATDKRRHFAARMAGSLSYAPGVTPLPSRNGWPPTPMRERPRIGSLGNGVTCDAVGCIGRLRR